MIIVPWFGDFPDWYDKYTEHIKHLEQYGYDFLFYHNLIEFNYRVENILHIPSTVKPNTSLSHNYRTAFGLIFEKEIQGYDFWGITDLDCVYGRVNKFISDEELKNLDIHSNHHNYICGPWTLFRNSSKVNNLFKFTPSWQLHMTATDTQPGRWTEVQFSRLVDRITYNGDIRLKYTHYQSKNPNDLSKLKFNNGVLTDDGDEIMMAHFNRKQPKQWPL